MDIVNPDVAAYMRSLLTPRDEKVLLEMEAEAEKRDFPIVGRQVGVTLEILARANKAQEVIELGSGFGYSAYWFSRALGPAGQLFLTDGDPANEEKALDYLYRAVLDGPVEFTVGDAVETLVSQGREWDIIYNDIDKGDYPDAWRAARDRVRVGGMYICDNVLWSGRVTQDTVTDDVREGWTEAIKEHNRMIAEDDRYVSTIVPTRDGVMVALRIT